jgi:hypoxanthine phosphoribosyltransferase
LSVRPLISAEHLARRVRELGAQITADHAGRELTVVSVLKGSFVFAADLVRSIELPVRMEFLTVSSYGAGTETTGIVQIRSDLSRTVEGEHLLVVEDIVDTGLTMRYLLDNLATRRPASLDVCSLLVKPGRERVHVDVRYEGFRIADEFVVGYGLDHDERWRNLPYLGVLSS